MESPAGAATRTPQADDPAVPEIPPLTVTDVLSNTATLAGRNLVKFYRNRQLLLLSVVQPLTNMMMFAYVLNEVARVPGVPYRQFVIPGVLIQAVMVTAMRTGVAVSYDDEHGMHDRLRSMPIARSAVLIGRTLSDTARIAVQTIFLSIVATAVVGFRYEYGLLRACAAVVVIVVFGFAVTTLSAWIGLVASDPESAQTLLITPVLPFVFGSSAFAPVSRLPGFIRVFATVNPVTSAVDLARSLTIGGPLLAPFEGYLLWTCGLIIAFTVLGVRRYQRG